MALQNLYRKKRCANTITRRYELGYLSNNLLTMHSEHFKTEALMLEWGTLMCREQGVTIISVVKDVSNGEWILFYIL